MMAAMDDFDSSTLSKVKECIKLNDFYSYTIYESGFYCLDTDNFSNSQWKELKRILNKSKYKKNILSLINFTNILLSCNCIDEWQDYHLKLNHYIIESVKDYIEGRKGV